MIQKKPTPKKLAQAQRNRERIRKYLLRCSLAGAPPTVREICRAVGLSSTATIQNHLRALEAEGFLVSTGQGKSRGWRVRESELEQARGIPVVGKIAAGAPLESLDHEHDCLPFPTASFSSSGEVVALRVEGESMVEAGIHTGDYAIIRRQPQIENGELAAVEVEGQGTLKRWNQDGDSIILEPANESFEPIHLDPRSDQVSVYGKLVGIVRLY